MRQDAGLSLLELAAVMAIFSVLALMGIQLLSQSILNRETLASSDARIAALTSATAVLRRDISQAVPQPDASGTAPFFQVIDDTLRLESASASGGTVRLRWRVDPATRALVREHEETGITTRMIADVDRLRIEVLDGLVWIDGAIWRAADPADLPRGMRVTITLADMDDVTLVVAR